MNGLLRVGNGANTANKRILAWNGDVAPPEMRYNETANRWEYSNDGTNFYPFGTGSTINYAIYTADQSLAPNTGIIANKSSLLVATLPATAEVGTIYGIRGMNANLWKIAQNASQYIKFGEQTTTTGVTGYLQATKQYDCLEFRCIATDVGFIVTNSVGNITYA